MEHLKSEQKGPDFRHCLKSELFDNGTIMKSAEIGTFGFQTLTVLDFSDKNNHFHRGMQMQPTRFQQKSLL